MILEKSQSSLSHQVTLNMWRRKMPHLFHRLLIVRSIPAYKQVFSMSMYVTAFSSSSFFFKACFLQQSYRNEVFPAPNQSYLTGLQRSKIFIYSCGSLWTSVIPCLVLRGIPLAIARSPTLQFKVLLLNSKHDRETANMTGFDFVKCVMNCSVTFLTYTQRDCSVAETDYASGYTK